ncbi:MAG: hypothetical protein ACK5MQ_12910 [Pikeienuella sp.]
MLGLQAGRDKPPVPGFMGRAVPGHVVGIVDSEIGAALGPGVEGAIAVMTPDPVMFLGYWNNPEAIAAKGAWMDGFAFSVATT